MDSQLPRTVCSQLKHHGLPMESSCVTNTLEDVFLGAFMHVRKLSALLTLCFIGLTGCSRSQTSTYEDAKTAGRHLGRGIRALFGDLRESRLVSSADVFAGNDLSQGYELAPGAEELAALSGDHAVALSPESFEGTPPIERFQEPAGDLAKVFQRIPFDTDSSKIEGPVAQKHVQQIAHYLQSHPELYVFVEGHCDERGPSLYNLSLGARRANAIRSALVKEGVEADRLFTISYGKERPVVPGSNADALRQNRRGQFKLYSQGE